MQYDVPSQVADGAGGPIADFPAYQMAYAEAAEEPDVFWLRVARARVTWRTEPTVGLGGGFESVSDAPLTWFADGELNVTETCLERHLATRGDKVAILWEGDEPGDVRRITFRELHDEVSRAAGALAALGVTKGDRVVIYMSMVPEAAIAMLACARLGAVHSVVFGGFSATALAGRMHDSEATAVITQDEGLRGARRVPLKVTVDAALALRENTIRNVLVLRRTGADVPMQPGRDVWWHDVVPTATPHAAVVVDAEHPLFILYTSGSTGQPKGLVHTSGGYLTYVSYTHAAVFEPREDDVYACVADVGWVTGHSYIVYGPLANGVTTFMFESVPTYPDAGRYWDMVQRHRINILYAAPTALRVLAAAGNELVRKYDRSSLRVLGSVGEPISPAAWRWYHEVVGDERCAVVDTWWQTETGGIAISPLAPITRTKPGSATLPLPGIVPSLRGPTGEVLMGDAEGRLALSQPWPGIARTVWRDHARYVATYFAELPGVYSTGDGCRRDADGYYWITGRVDDVINVSGHRMGTAEFESAIGTVPSVAECAVVGYPHDVKGQGVYAYVVPRPGAGVAMDDLATACRASIGAHAKLDRVQLVEGLPKTRSGKVMRRILRKIAAGDGEGDLGDLSTLADPAVVDAIREGYRGE